MGVSVVVWVVGLGQILCFACIRFVRSVETADLPFHPKKLRRGPSFSACGVERRGGRAGRQESGREEIMTRSAPRELLLFFFFFYPPADGEK